MELLTVILALVAGTLFMFYRNRRVQTNVFKSMGIPGPEPHWLTGNLGEYYKRNGFENYLQWEEQYGKTFGYYEGPRPIIVTSDPDFIREVFVKKFSNFHGRKPFALAPDPEKFPDVNMLMARGHRWKRLRSIINPTFSAHKLKQVLPQMQKKIDVLMEKFGAAVKAGQPVDVLDYYGKMTLDVIGESAFGLDIDSQHNPDEPFLKTAKAVFESAQPKKRPFIFRLAATLPEIEPYLATGVRQIMAKFKVGPFMWLKAIIHGVIEQRRQEKQPRADLLQLMLDAESTETEVVNVNMWEMKADDSSERKTQVLSGGGTGKPEVRLDKSTRKLTNAEIGNQSTVFLLAGYDTTSNLLAYLSYLLATNPDKQDILLQEIDKYKDDNIADVLGKMQYLDMCICEALRMYPVGAPIVARRCMEDTHVCGYDIPAGVVIQSNSMSLHYSPDLWGPVDTKLFHPERFLPENVAGRHDMAWIPFGAGPRNCVGMRFALMEAKHTAVTVLRQFSFGTCPQTEIPLKLREAGTISPQNGVVLNLVPRT